MADRISRRALFGLGLGRLREQLPDLPASRPERRPVSERILDEPDFHAISLQPVIAVAERFAPAPGERVLVTRGGDLEDCFPDHDELVAVAEPAEVSELPFEDGEFDRVLVPYAPVYAEWPHQALGELFRVTRPGGTVVTVVWTRERAVGRVLAAAKGWEPGVDPRLEWGDEAMLRIALAAHADEIDIAHEPLAQAWSSPEAAVTALERALPPVGAALAGFPGADANGLRADAARLVVEEGGRDVLTGAYLVARARKRA